MKTYSQNSEDIIILDYFKDFKGTLLSIGENDGMMFSNARLLIENGWKAYLFEPGATYGELYKLYGPSETVRTYPTGICGGDVSKAFTFYESGAHVPGGIDSGLVSTTDIKEMQKWKDRGVQFFARQVHFLAFKNWFKNAGKPELDFISIDCEGMDWEILQQINLSNTRALCIEWNGDRQLYGNFVNYCYGFGLHVAHKNNENLIFLK